LLSKADTRPDLDAAHGNAGDGSAVQLRLRLGRTWPPSHPPQRWNAGIVVRHTHHPDDALTVIVLAYHGDRILDHVPLDIVGMVLLEVARPDGADPDVRLSSRLEEALRGVTGGKASPRDFTPAMQAFLTTATARRLGEWIASHGTSTSLQYVQTERISTDRVLRYRGVVGGAPL
jgi:hypothetical protein